MALKSYKPTTPGQRGLVLIDRSDLFKGRPVKSLTEGLTKTGGRNNTGRITMWHKGGGAKRLYRVVDFKRTKFDMPAVVERILILRQEGCTFEEIGAKVGLSERAVRRILNDLRIQIGESTP